MSNIKKLNNQNRTINSHGEIQSILPRKLDSLIEFTCDCCFSQDIIETHEGYVCRTCGVVQEISRMEYYHPYNEEKIQNSILNTTQIGFKCERGKLARSVQLKRLNKLQNIKNNEENVKDRARLEIKRIFNCLDLPTNYKDMIFKKFMAIRSRLGAGTKYRSPEKLVPIVIYFVLKLHNYIIHQNELLDVSKISKKDFNSFKLQMARFLPQYLERNRKEYISRKLFDIAEHFELGMDYYHLCRSILADLWEEIKNTKDDVVAGLVCSIGILAGGYENKVSIFSICKRLQIRMSTIQSQVKKRIFENFRIPGFTTLIQSKDTLKLFLVKRHVLNLKLEAQVNEVVIQRNSLKAKLSLKVRRVALKGDKTVFNAFRESFAEQLLETFHDHAQTTLDVKKYQEDHSNSKLYNQIFIHNIHNGERNLILQFFSGKDPPVCTQVL
ncbi:MAG: cyclin family protein [Promethearchaeota archaeon]